jgi:uncharacterized Zn-binding protein involved in type VI secretion
MRCCAAGVPNGKEQHVAQKYLIVVGDSTTAGGEAIEGDPGWTVECLDGVPRPIVRINNTVICGQCGPTKPVQGATLFFSNGALAAYDGCLLACGHQMVSTKQRLHSVEIADVSPRKAFHSVSSAAAAFTSSDMKPQEEAKYALRFHATDYETGESLPHCRYVLTREDGRVQRGQCDEGGLTEVITSSAPERVSIHFVFTSPIGNSIPKSDLS